MGRLLILIAVVGLAAYLIKKIYLEKPEKENTDSQLMKKCEQCGMHIPIEQAVTGEGKFFCNEAHKDVFLNSHD